MPNEKEVIDKMDWVLHPIELAEEAKEITQSLEQESPPKKLVKTVDPRRYGGLKVKGKVPSPPPVTPVNNDSNPMKSKDEVFATKIVEKLKKLSQHELEYQFMSPESSPSARRHDLKITVEKLHDLPDNNDEQEGAKSDLYA